MSFNISPISTQLKSSLQDKINGKTKPLGALGRLEAIALQIGLIQNTASPSLKNPTILVFAADHGIAKEGKVNPYPQEVTAQMVYNLLEGGAAINSFCKQNDLALHIVDAGVNHSFKNVPGLIKAKIGFGTKNYTFEPAMTIEQCKKALEEGAKIVTQVHVNGCNVLGFGEMGIGNTSSAALLMSSFTEFNIKECVGAGTGLAKDGITRKVKILEAVLKTHQPSGPLETIATFGGFEIAMITGAILKAAELNILLIIDGFIVTAALLVAHAMEKNVLDYCIFSHTSGEQGHHKMLQFLEKEPLLNLGLRLGEGTGSALAFPIIKCATGFLEDMASFSDAKVSGL